MANNYQQYSFAITNLTPEEQEWVKTLNEINDYDDDGFASDSLYDGEPWYSYAVLESPGGRYVGGKWQESDTKDLWIYYDESGNVQGVAEYVQEFLAKFRPDEAIGFEWADWCSKPRLDEFGGGAVFITATDVQYMSTGEWLHEKFKEAK